jgi:hypothetical protein
MLKVVLTQWAQTSLEEIADYYLSEHTAARAIKVIESIISVPLPFNPQSPIRNSLHLPSSPTIYFVPPRFPFQLKNNKAKEACGRFSTRLLVSHRKADTKT